VTLFLLLMLARAPEPKTVTLDVKDEEIRVVLKSMQQQCGIKNLILDKEVQGKGTFLFRKLPCKTAFDTVFKTMSLRAVTYGRDVVNVAPRNK
jgi:type II secretory pathway component GspD/PulD (secretin)